MTYLPHAVAATLLAILLIAGWTAYKVVSMSHMGLSCHGGISFNEETERSDVQEALPTSALPPEQAAGIFLPPPSSKHKGKNQ